MSGDLGSVLGTTSDGDRDGDETISVTTAQAVLAGVGLVLVLGGLVVAVAAGPVAVDASVFLGVAALAVLVAGWVVYERVQAGVAVQTAPTVERRAGVRRTGSDLTAAVRKATAGNERERGSARVTLRRRLEPLAARVVATRDGCSEDAATEQLSEGTWTDDRAAAALFERGSGGAGLRGLLSRPPSVEAQVQSVVAQLGPELLGGIGETTLGPADEAQWEGKRVRWPTGHRETGRWRGIGAAGLVALAVAAFARQPGLVLVAATVLGVAAYARLGVAPQPELAVERSVSDEDPMPGDHVTVTVTVENTGDRMLSDLRVVDDVPPDLRVVDGSPSLATALRAGERATFSYDVLAVYGDHEFGRLYTVTRDPSGHHERTGTTDDGARTLTCEPHTVQGSVPLHPQTSGAVGSVPTDVGGTGHEFHSVREYRRGDPLRRVDWNRVARTGDLATLQFREEHAATVILLVDTRAAAFQAPARDALSAVDRSLAGAAQVYASLLADGDRVGLANVGLDWTWIGPGAGTDHRSRVRATLQSDPNFSASGEPVSFSVDRYVRRLRRRLPSDAQIVLFSPLLDEESAAVAHRLHAHGHSVTAFSPDPTTTDTTGGVVARMERTLALSTLRTAGIPVVDWQQDEPVGVAVERAARWRR